MSATFVLRVHPKPHCLSAWQLAELACGDAELALVACEHLIGCSRCHDLLQEQRAEVERAAQDALPLWLVEPQQQPPAPAQARPRERLARVGAVLAFITASALVWLPTPQKAPAPPGSIALLGTVLRSAQTIAHDTPVQRVPRLVPGDRLQLHVTGAAAGARAQLERREGDHWTTLYDAALPADPWLPAAVQIQPGPTILRLKVCGPHGTPCDERTFEL